MSYSQLRRFPRVTLEKPLRAFAGAVPVQLIDASVGGMGLLHQNPLPSIGRTCRLMFQSEFGPVSLDCEVVHTMEGGEPPRFRTGLRLIAADRQSQERLREMIASFL